MGVGKWIGGFFGFMSGGPLGAEYFDIPIRKKSGAK